MTRKFNQLVTLIIMMVPFSVLAHAEHGTVNGFVSGFVHPILGWDHLAAMVAVGLWGAFLGGRAIWMLPLVFPMVMAIGAVLGFMGVTLPAVEVAIAGSALILGVLIAFKVRTPLHIAAIIVGGFAIFHGHAHGTELPHAANPLTYSIGFVLSTGLIHIAGIGLGTVTKWPSGMLVVQATGGAIALSGIAFLTGVF